MLFGFSHSISWKYPNKLLGQLVLSSDVANMSLRYAKIVRSIGNLKLKEQIIYNLGVNCVGDNWNSETIYSN